MRSLPFVGSTLTLLLGLSSIALGQESSAGDVALARSLGLEGVQLADSGNCAGAIEKLQRAESLYHAPTILVRLGECQVTVGKVVAGTENLQKVVRETLPPKAPKPFVDAQARAQKSLAAALPKLAKLRIHVDTPAGVSPLVKLDGESVSAASLDADRPADPGAHHVEASAQGFRTASADTTLLEGSTGSVSLKLDADPSATAPPPTAPGAFGPYPPQTWPPNQPPGAMPMGPQGPAPVGAEASSGGSKTGAYVLLGVGAAGVAVGSIFGGLALGKRSALDSACEVGKDRCPKDQLDNIDGMKRFATISTVGFAVGGAGLAVGLILLVTAKRPAAGELPPATHASVRPLIGPGSLGLEGSF